MGALDAVAGYIENVKGAFGGEAIDALTEQELKDRSPAAIGTPGGAAGPLTPEGKLPAAQSATIVAPAHTSAAAPLIEVTTPNASGTIIQSSYEQGASYPLEPIVLLIGARGSIVTQGWIASTGDMTDPVPQYMIAAKSDLGANAPVFAAHTGSSKSWSWWTIHGTANKLMFGVDSEGVMWFGQKPTPLITVAPVMDTSLRRIAPTRLRTNGDLEHAANKGPIVLSPDGTRYRIVVANGGALSASVVADVLTHTFTQANGPVGAADTGQAAEVVRGTWTVESNRLKHNAGDVGARDWLVFDAGFSDFDASVVFAADALGGGFAFRFNKDGNCLLLTMAAGSAYLWKVANSSFAQIATWVLTGAGPWTFRVTGDGQTITAYEDGVQKAQITEDDWELDTKFGFYGKGTEVEYFDTLTVDVL